MQSELKPCPFCGSDELSHGYTQAGIVIGNVECHNCNALVTADTEAEAIAAWNTRSIPPEEPTEQVPVAWMYECPEGEEVIVTPLRAFKGEHPYWTETPLYAHPAPTPPATNEGLAEQISEGVAKAIYGPAFDAHLTTYNHAYTIAFSVSGSTTEDGSDVTNEMLMMALQKRIRDLNDSFNPADPSDRGGEWQEAVGAPFDTYEEEP